MKDVSVDINSPSYYEEPDSKLYRFKRKLSLKTTLKTIRRTVGNDRTFSLLEIGTGSGFLISFLESEFPHAKLTGLEYDMRLVSLAKSKVRNARIVHGNAEGFDLNNEAFDIIVSLQVIEHLYRPELMLSSVRKHLKPGGIFIFTTPNPNSCSARLLKNRWHGYRDDHVSLKNFCEWGPFLEKSGFISVYCGSTFFTGIPVLNKFPMGLINWGLLFFIGSMKWKYGESFVGIFKLSDDKGKQSNE